MKSAQGWLKVLPTIKIIMNTDFCPDLVNFLTNIEGPDPPKEIKVTRMIPWQNDHFSESYRYYPKS